MEYEAEGGIYSGNVLLDVYDSVTGLLTGERDVGNTRNLTFDPPAYEKKEKTGKRIENFGQTIESVLMKQTQACKFTLDDINKENLVLAMFGAGSVVTVTAAAVTGESVTAHLDKYSKLTKRKIKSDPAVEVKAVTPSEWEDLQAYALAAFVEPVTPNGYRYECTTAGTSGATEPTWGTPVVGGTVSDGSVVWTCRKLTYTLTTDYEIDYTAGMIRPLSTGAIAEGQSLVLGFSHYAYTGYNITANAVTAVYAQLRLNGKNVVNNDDVEVLAHKLSLIMTGGINWITDDFATLEFTGDILAVDAGTWECTVIAA